ncbi:MAG: hypothetical protein ACR2K5_15175 [Pseudolabrys sp.]
MGSVVLPILRTTLLGGALAAAGFLTGFTVPEATRPHLARPPAPASGALLGAEDHPEWQQFLRQAALRRAGELDRLRELPDQNAGTTPPPINDVVATLPAERSDAEPEDSTGSIVTTPESAMPIEIGETSSTELPVGTPIVMPPVRKLQSLQPIHRSAIKPVRKRRKARLRLLKPAKPAEAATSNPFSALFGSNPTP